jgi:hypothetical protein
VKRRGLFIALGIVVVLIVAVILAIGPMIRSRVEAAASKRGLEVQYSGSSYRFSHAELSSATVTPKGSKAIVIAAPTMDARLQFMTPTWVIIPRADVTVNGSVDDVIKALDPVKKADAALPADERLPIDVQGGTFKWKQPLGEDTSVAFSSWTAEVRPKESLMHAVLKGGKLELPQLSLGGITVDARRVTSSGEKLDFKATLAGETGHAAFEAHRKDGNNDFELSIEALELGTVAPKIPGLNFEQAVADGDAHAEWSGDGELRSNGKLSVSKLRLPPVKAGPVSLAIGGTVKVSWKGSPKKGKPGTMSLDDAKVEVTLGGKARAVKVRGDVSVGEDAHGPYLVNLTWEAGPFACAEIAGDLAGPLAKGLVSGAVSGNVNAKGTIKGDVTEIKSLKQSVELLEGCTVDVGKGLGGMLKDLPF